MMSGSAAEPVTQPASPFSGSWLDDTRAEVLAMARDFVARHATSEAQLGLFARAVTQMRAATTAPREVLPAVHLPLLVIAAVRPLRSGDLALSLATSLVELGADLLDHLADGELGDIWRDTPAAVVQLAGIACISGLPGRVIAELACDEAIVSALQATLTEKLLSMAAGQQRDIELTRSSNPTPRHVLEAVSGKSGDRRALYAVLAARYAGADDDRCGLLETYGRELGIARQLASDASDLFAPGDSRDLRRGARTWPIAWALSQMSESDRAPFLDLLDQARRDPGAASAARQRLRDVGALRRTYFEIAMHRSRALEALDRSRPEPEAGRVLESLARAEG